MELEYYTLQSDMEVDQSHKELEGTYENDAFYEELRRQILILTADDDDEDYFPGRPKRSEPCTGGAKRLTGRFASTIQPGGSYFSWLESEKGQAEIVPAWLVSLWRNGSGTGVFIPQIVKSRRRCRPGRKKDEKSSRTYRQVPARTSHYP